MPNYRALHDASIAEMDAFWTEIWQFGGVLGERPVALAGVGPTIEITAEGQAATGQDAEGQAATVQYAGGQAATGQDAGGAPVTAIAIPSFQWDHRDGDAMRVWMPC